MYTLNYLYLMQGVILEPLPATPRLPHEKCNWISHQHTSRRSALDSPHERPLEHRCDPYLSLLVHSADVYICWTYLGRGSKHRKEGLPDLHWTQDDNTRTRTWIPWRQCCNVCSTSKCNPSIILTRWEDHVVTIGAETFSRKIWRKKTSCDYLA
jgi:hypothetical protein